MRSVPSFGVCLAQMVLSVLAVPSCGIAGEKTAPPAKAEGPTVPKGEAPSNGAIDAWIRQLGDARYSVRESAQRALLAAGPHAMAALLQATKSTDPEVRRRAEGITKQIEANAAKVLEGFGASVTRRKDGSVSTIGFGQREDSKFTDADMVYLLGLPTLEILDLCGIKISDEGLKQVGQMTSLTELWLARTKVSDAGLTHLMSLDRLKHLNLEKTNVSGPGLMHLKSLTSLEGLCLHGSQITDAGLKEGVAGLKGLKKLDSIGLAYTKVSDDGLAHLSALKTLTRLSLIKSQVAGPGLAHLKALPNLEELTLEDTGITDDACSHLAELKGLRVLRLAVTKVTMKGLQKLKGLPKLRDISIGGNGLTEVEVNELRRAMPAVEMK